MRITAKVDYAVRAAAEMAADPGGPVKGEALAERQQIPPKFLENILADLRRAGLVRSQRGADGGYRLARPADEVTVADIIRAVLDTAVPRLAAGDADAETLGVELVAAVDALVRKDLS